MVSRSRCDCGDAADRIFPDKPAAAQTDSGRLTNASLRQSKPRHAHPSPVLG